MSDSIYKFHDKQIPNSLSRIENHPRSQQQQFVDPRAFHTMQTSSSLKVNPNNVDNSRFTFDAPNHNIYTDNNLRPKNSLIENKYPKLEMSVEDRIAHEMNSQKQRAKNTIQDVNYKPSDNGKYCTIEESCQNGVCSKIERCYDYNELKKDRESKPMVPATLMPCVINGKYVINLPSLYSDTGDYKVSCDACSKPSITDGYHYGKTDMCVPCFKLYNNYIKTMEQKDNNPRNNLSTVFDNFGSIYGTGGYNNLNSGAPY